MAWWPKAFAAVTFGTTFIFFLFFVGTPTWKAPLPACGPDARVDFHVTSPELQEKL